MAQRVNAEAICPGAQMVSSGVLNPENVIVQEPCAAADVPRSDNMLAAKSLRAVDNSSPFGHAGYRHAKNRL